MNEGAGMVYTIDPSKTALLLIDPQREYFDEDRPLYTPNAEAIRNNMIRLRQAADEAAVQTVLIMHVHKEDGSDLGRMGDFDPTPVFIENTPGVEPIAELAARDCDVVIEKTRYSAFVNTALAQVLAAKNIDTVVITGLMTNYCSVTTARHAHDLDYKVIFVSDANAGPDMPDLGFGPVLHEEIMRSVATSLAGGVADVVSTDEVLAQIKPT
jgi:nicotinamidase-related amidase